MLNSFISNRRFELGLLCDTPRGSFILRSRKYDGRPAALGFLRKERNMSAAVSKALRTSSRCEKRSPIRFLYFWVHKLDRDPAMRLSPKQFANALRSAKQSKHTAKKSEETRGTCRPWDSNYDFSLKYIFAT